jgi:uncharacterized protein (DUF362 family)
MSMVSFVKIRKNTVASMKQTISESLDLIGYKFRKDDHNIVIKPNMCYYWDSSTGQTTDPKFVAALVEVIRKEISPNANISIIESDASAMKCKYAFKFLGYEKLSQKYNVRLVNLSEDKCEPFEVTAGGQSFHIMVPRIIQNADLRINVTKIKYSLEKIKITCALKNIFGCNPYPKKFRYHSKLTEAIVAINKAMKFDLCLIDGNIVSGSQARKLGLVMASKDSVAIDVAAAKIAGVNPNTIGYIKLAHKEGLGDTHFVAKGVPFDYFKARYPRKDARKTLMSKAFTVVSMLKLAKRLGLE